MAGMLRAWPQRRRRCYVCEGKSGSGSDASLASTDPFYNFALRATAPRIEGLMREKFRVLDQTNAGASMDEFGLLSSLAEPSFDMAPYRRNGIQIVRNFFEPLLTERFKMLGAKVGEDVRSGHVTRSAQFAIGVDLNFEARLFESARLRAVAAEVLGEKIGQSYIRLLMKDKTFNSSIGAHQDWPYFGGDTRKLNVFIPLTPCGPHNGMIKFHVGSHALGPVERGDIDVERYPDLTPVVPDLEVGDVLFADILTWHSSIESLTDDDRIMIQLSLQPLSDPSSTIEFGKGRRAHLRHIPWRSTPMLNPRPSVGSDVLHDFLREDKLEEAEQMARGLSIDSPLNVEARLILAEIAGRRGLDNDDRLRDADAAHLELSKRVEQALGQPSSVNKAWAETTAALRADLAIQVETNRTMAQALDVAQRELAEQSTNLESSRVELQSIKNSSSWKLTGPIRALISRLRFS